MDRASPGVVHPELVMQEQQYCSLNVSRKFTCWKKSQSHTFMVHGGGTPWWH